jgi:hypothetical protein
MDKISGQRRVAFGLGAGALLVAMIAGPAIAADKVTMAITAGTKTASVADLTLTDAPCPARTR